MITTHQLSWNPETRVLSAEASDLAQSITRFTWAIIVQSMWTGAIQRFELDRMDYDASGEDVAGWWLKSTTLANPVQLLIIND